MAFTKTENKAKDGKFILSGTLLYPQGVMAKYNGNMFSGLFLIDEGRILGISTDRKSMRLIGRKQ